MPFKDREKRNAYFREYNKRRTKLVQEVMKQIKQKVEQEKTMSFTPTEMFFRIELLKLRASLDMPIENVSQIPTIQLYEETKQYARTHGFMEQSEACEK